MTFSVASPKTHTVAAPPAEMRRQVKLKNRRPTWAIALLLALGAAFVVLMFVLPTRELVGGASIALMLVLMFMKIPIGFALTIPGVIGMYAISGVRAMENIMTSTPMSATASWSLSVLPMFILMGMLLASSGITSRVYFAARLWTGWIPGGLAVGTNIAGAGLAAVSGSTIANSFALGRVGIPEMLRSGYDRRLAIGSVIMAGLPGQIIPPSTFLIIVAGITGAAVGPQLIAGVLPGLLMVVLVCLTIIIFSIISPKLAGRSKEQREEAAMKEEINYTWRERFVSLSGVWPLLVLFVAIFGTMFSGILTATEAGAMGAFVAILLTIYFRRKDQPLKHVLKGAREAVSTVGAIFFVLIGAHVLTQLIAVTRIGTLFSDLIIGFGLDRIGFLLVVMVVYLILGMFMDPLAILLLTIPILLPTIETLGIDLLWFGVFAVIMGELAILTPPVGVLTFIMHGLAQDKEVNLGQKISLKDVFVAVLWFLPTILILVVLLILFPEWVTFLPSFM